MRLRDYQTKATRSIEAEWKAGHRAVLLVMPPNAGKTVVFLHVVRKALKRGDRVCVVAPNVVLTQQTIDKFAHMDHGIIWAGHTTGEGKQLQIASAPTLANRLDEYEFDLIVVDEAHHCAANTWKKILDRYNTARVLGVTATPKRLDGKGLDACGFTGLVRGPWIDSLTPQYMTPYRMWAPNVPELLDAPEGSDYKASDLAKHGIEMGVLIGDAVKHYTKHCAGKRALAFCMSIEDSKATVKRFTRAGYKAAHMDGNTPHEERRALLDALNARRLDLLSSVNVLGEGLDIPGVDVVIQLRPTRSYQMWLQQLGRGFRLDAENPDKLLDVIDCAGNYFRFWSPSVDRGYGLDGAPALDVERQQTQRRCAECGLVYMADGRGYCPECHAETAAAAAADTERRAVWRDGELIEVGGRPLRLLSHSRHDGKINYSVSKTICGVNLIINLGQDFNLARHRVDMANNQWVERGCVWPDSEHELRLMLGDVQKRCTKRTGFPKANSVGQFIVTMNKFQISVGNTNNEAVARENYARLMAKCKAEGRRARSNEEAREWMGKQKIRELKFPSRQKDGQYSFHDGVVVLLGKVDHMTAMSRFKSYCERRRKENRTPKTSAEAKHWCGMWKLTRNPPLPLSQSGRYFYTSGKSGIKKVHLGTDPAIAQARVDAANARWEANGYKWPDTAEEFREWLTLPPPS